MNDNEKVSGLLTTELVAHAIMSDINKAVDLLREQGYEVGYPAKIEIFNEEQGYWEVRLFIRPIRIVENNE